MTAWQIQSQVFQVDGERESPLLGERVGYLLDFYATAPGYANSPVVYVRIPVVFTPPPP